MAIHPTAVISPRSRIGSNVAIGAFSVIEDDVEIGDGTEIRQHVVLANGARVGSECIIFPGTVIGSEPQDLKFKGENTLAIVGDRTVVREFVTINRGTSSSGQAVVGSDCLIMAYCHVAHDCSVGNNVILSNGTQLAGHVVIEDWVILGGMAKVVQFCTIGAHSMIGAGVKITKDILPFSLVGREPARVEGVNKIGLRRRGFTVEQVSAIDNLFTTVFFSGLNTSDALAHYDGYADATPDVVYCIDFIKRSKKGITR